VSPPHRSRGCVAERWLHLFAILKYRAATHTQPRRRAVHRQGHPSTSASTSMTRGDRVPRSRRHNAPSARAATRSTESQRPGWLMMDVRARGWDEQIKARMQLYQLHPGIGFRLRNPRSVREGARWLEDANAETLRHQVFGRGTAGYYAQLRTQHVTPAWIGAASASSPEQGRATTCGAGAICVPRRCGQPSSSNRAGRTTVLA